jgi:hypothetical protein
VHHPVRLASLVAALSLFLGSAAAANPPAASPTLAPSPAPVSYRPVIDLIPSAVWSSGGDEFSPIEPAGDPFVRGDVRLSYRVAENLTRRVSFVYFHNATIADNTLGRVVSRTGAFIYPQSARDILDDFAFMYALEHGYVRAGYDYEHRVCCPGASDPTNLTPAAWHAVYVEGQVHTPPIGPAHLVLSFTERASRVPHHVTSAYLAALPPGFTDSNRTEYGLTQTVGATADVAPKLQAFGTLMWGATYFFDNAPFPYQMDTFDYGLQRPINRFTTLRAEVNQQTQREQGYPFPAPNALHRARFMLSADFRLVP